MAIPSNIYEQLVLPDLKKERPNYQHVHQGCVPAHDTLGVVWQVFQRGVRQF